ncbi:FG-GAP repeat protein [Alteromonadaceae bacterium 2753L.S.0a.02]|nr:FG-GAP repeat protein [Alteromonadaceae bacterium 2753L.S.0a.02]
MNKYKHIIFQSLFIFVIATNLSGCNGTSSDDEDTSPDSFSFTDEDDVGLAETIVSDAIEISGINAATAISIEGGEYSINGATFTDEEDEVYNGDVIRVRVLSSDDLSTETETTLTIGDEEDTFTVETVDIALTARDGFKTIEFSWPSVSGATEYRLMEKQDENAEFLQKGRELSSAAVGYTMDVAIHKHDWLGAEYRLEACTASSCSSTDEISLYNYMRRSIGYIKATNSEENDQFGIVAMSADAKTIAVGAPAEDSSSLGVNRDDGDNSMSGSGAVYVYVKDDDAWRLQAYIKASLPDEGDGFGSSVSLSSDGNTLVVGAPFEDSSDFTINGDTLDNNAQDSGAVYVFERFGDVWFEHNYLKANLGNVGDLFGSKVSISPFGATLAISAPGNDDALTPQDGAAPDSGAVYLFKRDGDNWQQMTQLNADDAQSGAGFGSGLSLAANGNRLVVGARYFASEGDPAVMSGKAYVFDRSDDTWQQSAELLPSNAHEGMQFGATIALAASGNVAVIGAPGEKSNGFGVNGDQQDLSAAESGAAYIFALSNDNWLQTTYLKASNSDAGDRFGSAVAVSADADLIAVSAIGESSAAQALHGNVYDNSSTDAGAVYVFSSENAVWGQLSYVKSPNTDPGDRFGSSLALDASGDALLVGAPNEQSNATGLSGSQSNNTANKAGAAYLY